MYSIFVWLTDLDETFLVVFVSRNRSWTPVLWTYSQLLLPLLLWERSQESSGALERQPIPYWTNPPRGTTCSLQLLSHSVNSTECRCRRSRMWVHVIIDFTSKVSEKTRVRGLWRGHANKRLSKWKWGWW